MKEQIDSTGGAAPGSTYIDAYKLEGILVKPVGLSIHSGFSTYNDSDGIHDNLWGWGLEQRVAADDKIIIDLAQYSSSAPAGSIFNVAHDHAYLNNFRAGGKVRLAPAVYLTLLGGGSYRGTDGTLRPIFNFQITASPIDRWAFDLSAGREFLGGHAARHRPRYSKYQRGGGGPVCFRLANISVGSRDRRYWSDANQSLASEAMIRKSLQSRAYFSVDAGLLSHWEQFDHNTMLESGFFTPDRYRRHDGYLGLHGELRRLRYEVRGSGGAQQVARIADYRPDWDFTSSVSVRLGRALQLSATYQRRNYSLLSTDGWYQGLHFFLGIQP